MLATNTRDREVCELKINGIRIEKLQEISEDDLNKEGFDSIGEFFKYDYFTRIWKENPVMLVIDFTRSVQDFNGLV